MATKEADVQLENILNAYDIVNEQDMEEARRHAQDTGKDLASVLIDLGKVTEESIAFAIASELGVPFLQVVSEMLDKEKLQQYSPETLWKCRAIPLFQGDNEVLIVMSNPLNTDLRAELVEMFDVVNIHFAVGTTSAIVALLKECFKSLTMHDSKALAGSAEDQIEDPGAVLFVFRHLSKAFQSNAQEIHFTPEGNELVVYYRIQGKMVQQERSPISFSLAVSSRLKILGGALPSVREVPKKTIQTMLQGRQVKLNLSILSGNSGDVMTLAFEATSQKNIFFSLPRSSNISKDIEELQKIPNGLILLVNPDNHVTRSLAHCLLAKYQANGYKSFSVEIGILEKTDTVFQIDRNILPFSFESLLYGNPDALYIEGNIPDQYWQQILLRRLVLLSVSAASSTDALSWAVRRIPEIYLSRVLRSIIVFAPISFLCPKCTKNISLPGFFLQSDPALADVIAKGSTGCDFCENTGYKEETILWNCIWADRSLRELIANGPSRYDIAHHLEDYGNSLFQQMTLLLSEGKICPEQLWPYI